MMSFVLTSDTNQLAIGDLSELSRSSKSKFQAARGIFAGIGIKSEALNASLAAIPAPSGKAAPYSCFGSLSGGRISSFQGGVFQSIPLGCF